MMRIMTHKNAIQTVAPGMREIETNEARFFFFDNGVLHITADDENSNEAVQLYLDANEAELLRFAMEKNNAKT